LAALANPGFTSALGTLIVSIPWVPSGWALVETLWNLLFTDLTLVRVLERQLGTTATRDALATFLATPAVQQTLGSAVNNFTMALMDSPADRALVGSEISRALTPGLTPVVGAPAADALGTVAADTVVTLLGDPAVISGTGAVAGAAVTNLLGAPGVSGALADFAVTIMPVLFDTVIGSPADDGARVTEALTALLNNAAVPGALAWAVTGAFAAADSALLGNPAVHTAVGRAVATAVVELAAAPALQSLVREQLRALITEALFRDVSAPATAALATTLSDAVITLMSTPAVRNGVGTVAGSAVAAALGTPGLSTILTTAGAQLTLAVLSGTDPATLLDPALAALRANPTVLAALARAGLAGGPGGHA